MKVLTNATRMASITPRMSGLWATDYFQANMDEDDIEQQECDGRTPLDRTIDRIGMGMLSRIYFGFTSQFWVSRQLSVDAARTLRVR